MELTKSLRCDLISQLPFEYQHPHSHETDASQLVNGRAGIPSQVSELQRDEYHFLRSNALAFSHLNTSELLLFHTLNTSEIGVMASIVTIDDMSRVYFGSIFVLYGT